jgi:hypothetical protein
MCLSAKAGHQNEAWACRKPLIANKLRIWREAKRSVLTAFAIAAVLLVVLATYAQLMPPLPVHIEHDVAALLICRVELFS